MLPLGLPGPRTACLATLLVAACTTTSEHLARGVADVEAGRVDAGVEQLESALARGGLTAPERARAHAFAGHGWTLLGEPERALEHYEHGRADAPDDAWLCYASGVALRELGRTPEAVTAFTAALERDPDHLKSLQWRAELLLERDDPHRALADLDAVIALLEGAESAALRGWGGDAHRLWIWALHRRALCRGMLGDRDGANRDLVEASRLEDELRR